MKISLICGGPSLEKGISLNSARSVLDHLKSDNIDIIPFYLDYQKKPYKISTAQLYSNTPSDFDFKLKTTARALSETDFIKELNKTDIVFPVMHGQYGEDGGIQSFLEKNNLPFVGSDSKSCKIAFDKHKSNNFIKKNGFYTLPSALLKIYHNNHKQIITDFFQEHNITRAVVKPASGGSSIGVFSVYSPEEAYEKSQLLFSKRMDTRVVIEPFAQGTEFTIILLENRFGQPVSIIPTEIETDYYKYQIFDFRKKYLPTRQVTYHCPPRFDNNTIEKIQIQAEQIYSLFGLSDFARFDGWVMPDGNIWFSDFNPISGMEQNSFIFQQLSRIGFSHQDSLTQIVKSACQRNNIYFPKIEQPPKSYKKPVNIIFGGKTSERQVSLMSGTNVWLKLRKSKKYLPIPHLMDTKGNIWKLPYHLTLNHTVEEITENCLNYHNSQTRLNDLETRIRLKLGLPAKIENEEFLAPTKIDLNQFINKSNFVFIGLHGGTGENGKLQSMLEKKQIKFNGPNSQVSQLCMDKYSTSRFVKSLELEHIKPIPSRSIPSKSLKKLSNKNISDLWKDLKTELQANTLIVKPRADGCSSGIVHLYNPKDLKTYIDLLEKNNSQIQKNIFTNQNQIIEMPNKTPKNLLFEQFVETDKIQVKNNQLRNNPISNWIETTCGVVNIDGKIKALNPSLTIAFGDVLSVEEKFQGGTGINITPPPAKLISANILENIKTHIETLAKAIGIKGYSRIDTFVNTLNGDLKIIEINTLPGLTPSTVLYHQALAENPPISPIELIEKLIENKGY